MAVALAVTIRPELSVARIIARTIHCLVFGWTIFCLGSTVLALGQSMPSLSETSDPVRGGAFIGATFGVGMMAAAWFIPVVAGELVAIGLTLAAPKSRRSTDTNKREWIISLIVSSPINLLLLASLMISLGSASATDLASAGNEEISSRTPGDRRIYLPAEVKWDGEILSVRNVSRTEWTSVRLVIVAKGVTYTRHVDSIGAYDTLRFPAYGFQQRQQRPFRGGPIDRFYMEARAGAVGGTHEGFSR